MGVSVLSVRLHFEFTDCYQILWNGVSVDFKDIGDCQSDSNKIYFLRSWEVSPEQFFTDFEMGVSVLSVRLHFEFTDCYQILWNGVSVDFKDIGDCQSDSNKIYFLRSWEVSPEQFFTDFEMGVSVLSVHLQSESSSIWHFGEFVLETMDCRCYSLRNDELGQNKLIWCFENIFRMVCGCCAIKSWKKIRSQYCKSPGPL